MDYAALKSDLLTRGLSASSDPQAAASLLNAQTVSVVGTVSTDAVLTWGAEYNTLPLLQARAAKTGDPLQGAAMAVLMACQGSSSGLALSNAKIRAMLVAFVAVGDVTQAAADALVSIGTVQVSYAQQTYGRYLDYADVIRAWR